MSAGSLQSVSRLNRSMEICCATLGLSCGCCEMGMTSSFVNGIIGILTLDDGAVGWLDASPLMSAKECEKDSVMRSEPCSAY